MRALRAIIFILVLVTVILFPDVESMHLSGHTCVDPTHEQCDGGEELACDCDGLGCSEATNK
jgi:hypothetical protein